MDLSADIPLMFAEFGSPATLAGLPVSGYFDDIGQVASVDLIGVDTTGPSYLLATTSVPVASRGLLLAIAGHGNYLVRRAVPEGPGLTRLHLEHA